MPIVFKEQLLSNESPSFWSSKALQNDETYSSKLFVVVVLELFMFLKKRKLNHI